MYRCETAFIQRLRVARATIPQATFSKVTSIVIVVVKSVCAVEQVGKMVLPSKIESGMTMIESFRMVFARIARQ